MSCLQWLVLCALVAVPVQALADPKTEANEHFAKASVAHKEGRYADAMVELEAAFALDPRPELLYALGQLSVKLGRCPDAISYYRRFLATHPKPGAAAHAQQAIEVCNMSADQRPPEQNVPLGPSPEEHLRKAKEAEAVAAVERRKVELARIEAEREREREREKLYDKHPTRTYAYVGAGIGAASLIAGGVFGISARNAQSSFDDAGCGDRDRLLGPETIATCQDDEDRGARNALLGNVFLGAGAAILATSLIVFAIDPGNLERPEQARTALRVTPASIQLSVRW